MGELAPSYWVDLACKLCSAQPGMGDSAETTEVFKRGNVLSLEGLDYIPGADDMAVRSIWVASQYMRLAASIDEVRSGPGGRKNIHLIGTAGTGKSMFGLLWLYMQAKRMKRVVYRTKSSEYLFFDFGKPDSPQVLIAESLFAFKYVLDASTWLIIDGASPYVTSPGPILQCVSDTKSNHHEFAKQGYYLYGEAWPLDDCTDCAAAIGLGITDMPARYYYCGGVPRHIFPNDPDSLREMIDTAFLNITSTAEFMHLLKIPEATINTMSDKLFHYQYPNGYIAPSLTNIPQGKRLVPASPYVLLKADELFKLDTEERRDRWVRESAEIPEASALRGWRFERCSHRRISQGGSFEVKDLMQGTQSTRLIAPAAVHTVYNWELYPANSTGLLNIQGQPSQGFNALGENHYVRPVVKNQQSWDAFLTGTYEPIQYPTGQRSTRSTPNRRRRKMTVQIFQKCVTKKHPVKWDGIEELMTLLNKWCDAVIEFELVFAVPEDIYHGFPLQEFLVKDGKHLYQRCPAAVKTMKQYAMKIVV